MLIGAYLVWKHGFSAGEAIGFMRFMRPGCVVGRSNIYVSELCRVDQVGGEGPRYEGGQAVNCGREG